MKRVVFCDFDGTITAVETFTGMLKEFAPDLSAELIPQMYERKLTLREGVRQLLESIPSRRYSEIIEYCYDKAIRPGLPQLLDFLEAQGVPFVVVSGGIRGMIEQVLSRPNEGGKTLIERVASISAVDIKTTGEFLQATSEFADDTELVAKVLVMEKYPAEEKVAIGDSVTDINMALRADLVFARDRLVHYLDAEHKLYLPWNDFFDVLECLQQRWQ